MPSATSTARLATLLVFLVGCGSATDDDDSGDGSLGGTSSDAGSSSGGLGHGGTSSGVSGSGGASSSGTNSGGAAAHAGSASGGNAAASGSGGMSSAGSGGVAAGAGGSAAGNGGTSAGAAGSGAGGHAGSMSGGGGSGGSGVVFPPSCTCLGMGPPQCTPTGDVTFTLARSASPTADEQSAYDKITCAMTAAVAYYNCNTTISKKLNVSYVPSVATADGSYNGSIRFGSDRSYMACATGMHEIAHTVGVGTAPNWPKVSTDGLFNGATAIAELRKITGKTDDVLHSDTQHFWPYGLNYESEAKSIDDLLDHCSMVTAIRKDLGL